MFAQVTTLTLLLALASAHNPSVIPYEAIPGYTDCSQMDSRSPHYKPKPACVIPPKAPGTITISCVGDSITAGGWPQIMQTNLNAKYPGKYNVINFGECGSTMQINADSPYVKRGSWPKVLNTSSDIIIIMLGTNDSKTKENNGPPNWENDGVTGTDECECICFISNSLCNSPFKVLFSNPQ